MTEEFQALLDGELARRTQAGSLEAFEELVSRYEGRVYRFVLSCCRREADAREITQDAFVRAYQSIAGFDIQKPFAPWLFTIARRKHLDYLRAAPPVADEPAPEMTDADDPSRILARTEEHHNLWIVARHILPELQFQALWLRYAEDMTVAEIARVLSRTETHVKVLMFRARQALAAVLPAEESASPLPAGRARRPLSGRTETPLPSRSARKLQPPGWSPAQ